MNLKISYNRKYLSKKIAILRYLLFEEDQHIPGLAWKKILDIEHLYQLQDRVFNILSKIYTTFYLAGGTALHRFYYNARYSYDLDFFTQNNPDFSQEVREFIELLDSQDLKITKEVQTRDFF